jgi:hypothetical protein
MLCRASIVNCVGFDGIPDAIPIWSQTLTEARTSSLTLASIPKDQAYKDIGRLVS